jgi:lipid-binding SYLF domain-containing protein
MSVEGIGIIQRNDANEKFYGNPMTPEEILFSPAGKLRPKDPAGQAAVSQLQEVCSCEVQLDG